MFLLPYLSKAVEAYEEKVKTALYENKEELNLIMAKYESKLYTLMSPMDIRDRQVQSEIVIRLVRIAQKGNVLAKQYVIECMTFIIYEWIDSSRYISKWKGYTDGIEKKVEDCIRNYRYSGNFMNYVFRTFQYSARGLRPTYSLDDTFGKGAKRRIDYVIQQDDDM